jgi:hypothetical protein
MYGFIQVDKALTESLFAYLHKQEFMSLRKSINM